MLSQSQQQQHYTTSTSSPRVAYPGEREVERRQASSTIVHEEYLSALPQQGEVRYVEVPVVEEVVRRVPKKEVIEVEKIVPRYETEWVETIVEVPQIQVVERQVEVPQVHEVVRTIPKKEYVDVPREVVRTVPRVEVVQVEKVVEVPGQIIEVPKPYTVENKVQVPRFVNNEVPMIVAQTIKPIITETSQAVDVDVYEYEPQVVVVDVTVPKPVPSQLIAAGMVSEQHKLAIVPAAQYNSMLRMLNTHIQESEHREVLPFVVEASGAIPMLHGSEASMMYPAPIGIAKVEGYISGVNASRYVQMQPGMTIQSVKTQSTSMMMSASKTTTTQQYGGIVGQQTTSYYGQQQQQQQYTGMTTSMQQTYSGMPTTRSTNVIRPGSTSVVSRPSTTRRY